MSDVETVSERNRALHAWARNQVEALNLAPASQARSLPLAPASEDASFRRYWRLGSAPQSWVVMDAPPQHEDCGPFVDVSQRLVASGLHATEVLAADLARGFLLLSDLGQTQYLNVLHADNADALYGDAMQALLKMQQDVSPQGLPVYDANLLQVEMDLFTEWLLEVHLQLQLDPVQRQALSQCRQQLVAAALEQPRVFVHLDYHSRNLMHCQSSNPGILDFQDARHGPITYDLVSLLRDCYVRWPVQQVRAWSEGYRQHLQQAELAAIDAESWQRWFDWMGVQRHLKAAGIFARLLHRDGKAGFIADVPRTLSYVSEVCAAYPQLAPLGELIDRVVLPALSQSVMPGKAG